MKKFAKASRTVYVISDLHLGGASPFMMSRPEALARFIERLTAKRPSEECVELVIAGDFVDFLAIEPTASFTPDPESARDKLRRTMRAPPFNAVFISLGKLLDAGHALTVLVGNHELELAMPPVQDVLLTDLAGSPRALRFIDDGRAYRIGRALIEHGNRYDNANTNDWTGVRAMASALSRFESPPQDIAVSAGSRLVDIVINPLKKRYPFIDLLQPQNELVVLLLFAFEPGLIFHLRKLARVFHARYLAESNKAGAQPGRTRAVGYVPGAPAYDTGLAAVFPEGVCETLYNPLGQVSAGDLARIPWQVRTDSLVAILSRGDKVPSERLQQIRQVMQRLLLGDDSHRLDGDTAQYGKAATRIIETGRGAIDVVLMGHTHLARCSGPPGHASYINTGTWADIVRVPALALADPQCDSNADATLTEFLHDLLRDRRPVIPRPFAELEVAADGAIIASALKWHLPEDTR